MIYAMNHEEVLFYQDFSIQISCLIDQRIVTFGSKLNYFSIYWTGFENRHAAPYYTYRCNIRHSFTKCSAGSDMKSQLICAVVIQHHPVSHDIKHFPKLFSQMLDVTPMSTMVLDKGYDSESIHKTIRDENIISMIPVRGENTIGSTKGKYRKQMRREFDVIIYSQRNKTETIFSVVKRRFGSELDSHNDVMKTKELLYRVLAYNCHRMCIISCFVLVMISRKPILDVLFFDDKTIEGLIASGDYNIIDNR